MNVSQPSPSIKIQKTADKIITSPGGTVVYTISYANVGNTSRIYRRAITENDLSAVPTGSLSNSAHFRRASFKSSPRAVHLRGSVLDTW